jgi:Bacterial PH domain
VGYIEKNLVPGEKVLYKTRLHWIVLLRPLLFGLLLAGGGLALLTGEYYARVQGAGQQTMLIGGIALLAAGGIVIVAGFIRRSATEVAVSNQRVLIKTGMYSRRSIEVMLSKVESIGVEEPALGRMLGYGSVIIRGTGGTFETFHLISHPNEFRRQVQQQIGQPR